MKFNPAAAVRHLVSAKKCRYQHHGFDLDLSYITDRLIAMGIPCEGAEAFYRNPMSEVKAMLNRQHGGHYKVYNLCSEYVYDSDHFEGRVARYPFDDHQTTTLTMILDFCRDVQDWLQLDTDNVAVVHCKAGKGRTGLMICCVLLFTGVCTSPEEAIRLFGDRRTHNGRGLTIPSQKRYVGYANALFTDHKYIIPPPQRLVLERLTIGGLPWRGDKGEFYVVLWVKCGEDAASVAILEPSLLPSSPGEGHVAGARAGRADGGVGCSGAVLSPLKSGTWEAMHRSGTTVAISSASEGSANLSSFSMPAGVGAAFNKPLGRKPRVWGKKHRRGDALAREIFPQHKPYKHLPSAGCISVPCQLRDVPGALVWDHFSPHVLLVGNVKVEVFQRKDRKENGKSLGYTWFNTSFLPGAQPLWLPAGQLDKVHVDALTMQLSFVPIEDCWTSPPLLSSHAVSRARSFSTAELSSGSFGAGRSRSSLFEADSAGPGPGGSGKSGWPGTGALPENAPAMCPGIDAEQVHRLASTVTRNLSISWYRG
mmetsp:Transcript_5088/g.12990  ORF Transcript_5088/g.12990 Transcript_5088/m.12990 type:complete len:537 (-) Transcript_5088:227-1837(-)|eukprot:jgi/Tetstr1/463083/TSEL_008017.t1